MSKKINHTELVLAAKQTEHEDSISTTPSHLSLDSDTETALGNLERRFPGGVRNKVLARKLAWTVMLERSRREAHSYRYRLMTGAAMSGMLFDSDENLPEASLLDIEERTGSMTDVDRARAAVYSGKGISAELGHVDQLGDWDAGHVLDDAVRRLPESKVLADAGFVFGETYIKKDTAQVTYEFYITDGGLKVKRKRAAADIITERGTMYDLVKSSVFFIDEHELQQSDVRSLRSVKRMLKDDSLSDKERKKRDAVFSEAGAAIVEPFIVEKDQRNRSTAVLAATSLYFALVRHQ